MMEIKSDKIDSKVFQEELNKVIKKIDESNFKKLEVLQTSSLEKEHSFSMKKYSYKVLKKLYKKVKYLLYKFNLFTLERYLEKIVEKAKNWNSQKQDSNEITLDELLKFHDREFISYAYKKILKREVDEKGLYYYLNLLRSGKRSRNEIIVSLRYSQEGKQQHVSIKGLSFKLPFYFFYKIPVIGYITKIIIFFFTSPKYIQRYNMMETQIFQLFDKNITLERNQQKLYEEIKSLNETTQQQLDYSLKRIKELSIKIKDLNEAFHIHKEKINKEVKLYLQDILISQKAVKESEKSIKKLLNKLEDKNKSISSSEIKQEKAHLLDSFYLSFENHFRGEEAEIKKRQEFYLPFIQQSVQENDTILDIGCGRGEWLSLLKENNFNAQGIELNRITSTILQERGFNIINENALTYLNSLEDNSIGAITAFHVVEHLDFPDLIEFLEEAYRVLKKNGVIILETPNPENILVGSCSFYVDPTHKNPIPSQTLEFMLQNKGFKDVSIKKLHPLKAPVFPEVTNAEDINLLIARLATAQDYAVIGYKNEE